MHNLWLFHERGMALRTGANATLFDLPSCHDLYASRRPWDKRAVCVSWEFLDYLLSCGLLGSNILNAVPL